MRWTRVAALSLVTAMAAACAGGGACATHAPKKHAIVDPPPPASLEVNDVEAWASAYIDRDMWTLITHDLEGARFVRPEAGKATAPFTIEADIRTELFHPVKMGAGWARSGLAHWSVDCAGSRYAVQSMTIYSHNNLKVELARKPAADADWMIPNEFQIATIKVICKSVLTGQPPTRESLAPAKPS